MIRVVEAEQALLARYDELLTRRLAAPARALVHTLRAAHAEHVRLLGERPITGAATSARDPAAPADWVELDRAERSAARTAMLALEAVDTRTAVGLAHIAADDLASSARLEVGPARTATAVHLARRTTALPALPDQAAPSGGASARQALVTIVAGEHAAVWGMQVVAARAPRGDQRALGLACLAAHEAARDAAARWVRAAGGRPPPPAPGYALPPHLQPPSAYRQLAVLLEQRTGRRWAQLVGLVDGQDRRLPAEALAGTAIRAVAWTHRTPGEPTKPATPTEPATATRSRTGPPG